MDQEEEKSGVLLPSLEYGSYIGLILVFFHSVQNLLLSSSQREAMGWVSSLLLAGLLVLFIRQFREKDQSGVLNYGRGLGSGTLMGLFASIILSIYTYIYFKFAGDDLIVGIIRKTREALKEQGIEGEQMESIMGFYRDYVFTPFAFSFWSFVGTFFVAFLASLIIPIFLKRKAPSHE